MDEVAAKKWFEGSGFQYRLAFYDEGGQNGIDDDEVAKMLVKFYNEKINISLENYIIAKKVYLETTLKVETQSDNCDLSPEAIIKIKSKIALLDELIKEYNLMN